MSETKQKRAKPKTPKPHAMAFIADTPCPICGCEWFRPTVTITHEIVEGIGCANLWCPMIAQLRQHVELLAKLAADTPQFFNPLHAATAVRLRDHILAKSAARTPAPETGA